MTKEEYYQDLSIIEQEFQTSKDCLDDKYILSNSPYKFGDIIENGKIQIQIKHIYLYEDGDSKTDFYFTYVGDEMHKGTVKFTGRENCRIYSDDEITKIA